MTTSSWDKAAADEFTTLKDEILVLKRKITTKNKRIHELEPKIKQMIVDIHMQDGGSPESEVMPVLLFEDKGKVIELKFRRRTPTLNMKLVEAGLRNYLVTQPQLLINIPEFLTFLKLTRKDGQRGSHVIQYREAKLSELHDPATQSPPDTEFKQDTTNDTIATPILL